MIRIASTRLSYSTDPIAAGVHRALATSSFVAADRSNEAPAGAVTGGRLDLSYLYPSLEQPAAHTGVASRLAAIGASITSLVSGRAATAAARR